jgi:uncharacterized protein YgiM (DUF1202 family)
MSTATSGASLTITAPATTMSSGASLTITPPGTTETYGIRTVMASYLNVRAAASMLGRRLGHLKFGSKVDVQSKVGGTWCQITFNSNNAYIACRYLMK